METRAEGVADSIDTYWQTEKLDGIKDGIKEELFSKINNANFTKIAQRWVNERSNDPDLMDIIIQIFDPRGNNIAYSRDLLAVNNLPERLLKPGLRGKPSFSEGRIDYAGGKSIAVRVFTVPVIESGKNRLYCPGGQPFSRDRRVFETDYGPYFFCSCL